MVADILNFHEYQIKQKNVTVHVEPLLPCYGDMSQIGHVFSNLIHNALKFLDESRPGKLHIYSKINGADNTYCIEDNGIGIDREYHAKIFEVFHQIEPNSGEGQGLGLSIVKRIVDRHNGKVSIKSESGKGSEFFVSLPGV